MTAWLIVAACAGPSVGFVAACLLGAGRAKQLEEERDDARYERDVNAALLVASQAEQRHTQAKAAHPAGRRDQRAWAALVGDTTTIIRRNT